MESSKPESQVEHEAPEDIHGISVDGAPVPSVSDEEIDRLAEEVSRRGLGSTVLFFLEAHRPLRGMLYHLTTLSTPLFVPFFGANKLRLFMRVIESDATLEKLIERIEEKAQK